MNIAHITTMLTIGQLSLDWSRAESVAKFAKFTYHEKIREFEEENGRIAGRIDPNVPKHAAAIAFTRSEYDAYRVAKRKAYNVKRRWQNACQKIAQQAA